MTKSEKRWQLLLVADDGRIVPFKHIKGVALTLLILVMLLALVCAGLSWKLARETIRYHKTMDQLSTTKKEVEEYKRKVEVVTAELILAEARMLKAGLAVEQRSTSGLPQTAPSVESQPEVAQKPQPSENEQQALRVEEEKPALQPAPAIAQQVSSKAPEKEEEPKPVVSKESPGVELGDLELDQSLSTGKVTATLRLSNKGSRSSPAEGWCLVVLKNNPRDTATWMGLPGGTLVKGATEAEKGKKFKVSRFVDVALEGPLVDRMLPITKVTAFVFNEGGSLVLEKDYPISQRPVRAVADTGEVAGIDLSDFEIHQEASSRAIKAMFRLKNKDSQSGPVSGHYMVILKNEQMASDTWAALPAGAIVGGKPNIEQGQAFKISRYNNMQVEATVEGDPSRFDKVVLHIFDTDGAVLLERAYSIRLAAFAP